MACFQGFQDLDFNSLNSPVPSGTAESPLGPIPQAGQAVHVVGGSQQGRNTPFCWICFVEWICLKTVYIWSYIYISLHYRCCVFDMILEFQVFINSSLFEARCFVSYLHYFNMFLRSKGSTSHLWLYWQSHGRGWPRQPPSKHQAPWPDMCQNEGTWYPSRHPSWDFEESTI